MTVPCFDFHCHSSASDGELAPAELVARAAAAGVAHLALTDHDTLAGQSEARTAARKHGINLIPGMEVSVQWQTRELHVVGLAFDPEHAAIRELVDAQQGARVRRARKMGERLDRAAGLAGTYEGAAALSGQKAPGRPWFARVLVAQGRARDDQHAFNRFLKPGQSGFVATPWVTLEGCVAAIRAAGGVAVLAHPVRYGLTRRKLRQVLRDFTTAGGRGIESLNPGLNATQRTLMAECLRDFPLLASGGSDFHSPRQAWLELGRLAPLPENVTPVWNAFDPAWGMAA